MNMRARVFISCGQRKNSPEVDVAQAIAETLTTLGFDPYIATQEQTLRGLKENIFDKLAASEYFLFVDFQREQIANKTEYRGSLFSHQELALASYLGLEVMAFQESGVIPLDGMLGILQMNAISFSDRGRLPGMVREQKQKAGWRPNWRNELRISQGPYQPVDLTISNQPGQPMGRFLHIRVDNLNPRKVARNCTGYIQSIIDKSSNAEIPLRTSELKWAGFFSSPSVSIMPGSYRDLDAFFLIHSDPNTLRFNCFSDSGLFMTPIQGPGHFEITYMIVSDNFEPTTATFEVRLTGSWEDVGLVASEGKSLELLPRQRAIMPSALEPEEDNPKPAVEDPTVRPLMTTIEWVTGSRNPAFGSSVFDLRKDPALEPYLAVNERLSTVLRHFFNTTALDVAEGQLFRSQAMVAYSAESFQ